jgi:hypothetical protein
MSDGELLKLTLSADLPDELEDGFAAALPVFRFLDSLAKVRNLHAARAVVVDVGEGDGARDSADSERRMNADIKHPTLPRPALDLL